MTSKPVPVFLVAYAFSMVLFGHSAKATIVDIIECRDLRGIPLPSDHWRLNHDSQVLTVTLFIDDTGPDPLDPFRRSVSVTGRQDAHSILTVVENITNETGVPFTGYAFHIANPLGSHGEIVAGSVQATGSAQVYQHSDSSYELAWTEPIHDEGTFSIQFDVLNYMMDPMGAWHFAIGQTPVPVPEPVTMALLGLGGLLLLSIRKAY